MVGKKSPNPDEHYLYGTSADWNRVHFSNGPGLCSICVLQTFEEESKINPAMISNDCADIEDGDTVRHVRGKGASSKASALLKRESSAQVHLPSPLPSHRLRLCTTVASKSMERNFSMIFGEPYGSRIWTIRVIWKHEKSSKSPNHCDNGVDYE